VKTVHRRDSETQERTMKTISATRQRLGITALIASAICGALPVSVAAVPLPQTPASNTAASQESKDAALAKAVAKNDVAAARTLLQQGAYANTLLSEHRAAGNVLHAAAADGHLEMVRCLLDHGADPIHRNRDFETARDLAQKGGHTVLMDLLRLAEDGNYKPARVSPPAPAKTVQTAVKRPVLSKGKSNPAPRASKTPAKASVGAKRTAGKPESAADRRAKALKRLNDYNYVKHFGPISGPTYRSSKW
jgi:cell division protein FtsN